jgi:ZIP family zinc transporter
MSNVVIYGLISVFPLFLGAIIGSCFNIKERFIGAIAAFGSGALIAALTFGLMEESFRMGGLDSSILGFLFGGILFIFGDYLIIKVGGRGHKRYHQAKNSTGWGIVLAAFLDGLPESFALGISLALNPKIGLLVLVAIILNNMPEAISSAYDLKHAGKKIKTIVMVWLSVAVICFVGVLVGFLLANFIPSGLTAMFEAIAAGAVLAMLAITMMPEAYRESGMGAAFGTLAGFLLIFILSKGV